MSLTTRIISLLTLSIVLMMFLWGCGNYDHIPYDYSPPPQADDHLQVATLEESGMDTALINQAVKRIIGGALGQTHSLLICRDNHLVLEEYFPGNQYQWDAPGHYGPRVQWNKDMRHNIMSVNKSITATCVGIAIDKGMIGSVEDCIFDYLPEHQQYRNDGRELITIEDLLTMTSGLDWSEWGSDYSSTENPIIGIWFSEKDPVSYILEAPLVHEPGTWFSYYGGNQILLGEILHHATGMKIDAYADRYLFQPLGIDKVEWTNTFPNGVIECAANLKMTPRDMMKFGLAFLNNGTYGQQQIIDPSWVERSSHPFASNTDIVIPGEGSGHVGYGYSWWTKTLDTGNGQMDIYWANGWGGQKVIVIPDKKAVVVFTGAEYNSGTSQFSLLEDYLLPAMK